VRLAVLSDTHLPRGSRRLPAECLELVARADLALHAGDFTSVAFWEELRALGPPVHGVSGNMDEPALKESLPKQAIVEIEDAKIGMVHIPGPAAGRSARLRAKFPDCAAVVYGHTHIPEAVEEQGVWILNPGSPTERRKGPVHSMLVLAVAGSQLAPKLVRL
jgi:putative phosphoesterase